MSSSSTPAIAKQFPWKLHEMLDAAEKDSNEHIVSWLPCGRAFKVHKRDAFVNRLMKVFFNQTKYKSFQRQLNLWGFERITNGDSVKKGAYCHPLFVKGRPELCPCMTRQKVKNTVLGAEEAKALTARREETSGDGQNLVTQHLQQHLQQQHLHLQQQQLLQQRQQTQLPAQVETSELARRLSLLSEAPGAVQSQSLPSAALLNGVQRRLSDLPLALASRDPLFSSDLINRYLQTDAEYRALRSKVALATLLAQQEQDELSALVALSGPRRSSLFL